MGRIRFILFMFIIISISSTCESWSWFSFSSKESTTSSRGKDTYRGSVAEFSIEGFNNQKGIKLVENAKNKMVGSNSCWQNAYRLLFSGCSEILAVEEKRSRLAWHLSDCFQKDSGRPPFPHCDQKHVMSKCLKALDDLAHKVYLEFYLETNSICHQLQAYAFKHETERLVTELKSSAQYVEDKLVTMEERSEQLLQGSKEIHDSVNSIDIRTQQVSQTAKNLEGHIAGVLQHSELVYEQAKKIEESQSQLQEGQGEMKKNLEEGMAMLNDSYNDLDQEIDKLRDEAAEIEKEITKVGDEMSSKMITLQTKAEDIGNLAGISLDKQQQLLDGQSTALKGLQSLSKFQSEALQESRETLQNLVEYGHKQQKELLQRQEQLQQVHDRLMENSKSILAAQESFELKQASMFVALDKLYALHNAMWLESRLIKAFIIYFISIFVIYMFTSTKQTYNVRPWLYIGLCVTFFVEFSIIRFGTSDNIEQQSWMINLVRLLFVLVASIELLYAIFTYRDYEVLNHKMLQSLIDKVNSMQKFKELSWDTDIDSDVNWSSWIDTELPEEVNNHEDPDYIFPEEVGENSITTTNTRYNLRQRKHWK
ncbi:Protein GAMETE EXPRESSED 1 [Quillaja saponaria]|uniref:Protein GAMETE EXPRESSED 1 n=1 Tax=Quillaja saponaria TaxID=32244 RepID=A0AAD7PMF0_QUISA|nr:Protein GAMETE EXPRESSED 1 [Quillaja saponaria]